MTLKEMEEQESRLVNSNNNGSNDTALFALRAMLDTKRLALAQSKRVFDKNFSWLVKQK